MRTFKRSLALVLAIAMVLTTFGMTVVSAAQYNDTEGHWAESYINTWSGYGVIQGDGGYFRPDDAITRAEVAQVPIMLSVMKKLLIICSQTYQLQTGLLTQY